MTDYGIKPEWREDWKIATSIDDPSLLIDRNLADLSLHLLRQLMESEFNREHRIAAGWDGARECLLCDVCGYDFDSSGLDPRHNFQAEQWMAAAREEMEKCVLREIGWEEDQI